MHTRIAQQSFQGTLVVVATSKAHHGYTRAQAHEIHGHVGRASRLFAATPRAQHRHWRLRRNSLHLAPNILVQHQVAHHQHLRTPESALHHAYELRGVVHHPAFRCAFTAWAIQVANSTQSHSLWPHSM